ncbi:hypothetical protein ABZT07_20670 [Streptomyces sp. NPDC005317]|uniref:hypothetical protein n=1 Tax=Streptomyces sp. NPDC005317 TaxID=3156876 RepID=UPI0033BBA7FE
MNAYQILAAILAPSVLYVLRGLWVHRAVGDEAALARAERDLAPHFDAYAGRIDALYGKGE